MRALKAQDILDNALVEGIPTDKNGRIIVNEYRKIILRNSKALIIVTNQNSEDFKSHVTENNRRFKIITNVGITISFVLAVAMIGIHTSWDIAGGVSVAGGLSRMLSYLLNK